MSNRRPEPSHEAAAPRGAADPQQDARTQPGPAAQPERGGRLPSFLIVGAPKGGTTSLAAYLSTHPQVVMSQDKELHFFDDHLDLGVEWYRAQFAGSPEAIAAGEASPTYLYRQDAHSRMAEVVPEARLIAILRNPVDRAYSDYWFQRSLGFEKRAFPDAISDELRDPGSVRFRHVEMGRYVHQLRRLCQFYPREQILVLTFEDLRDDAVGTYARVCRFVGVDETFVPPNVGRAFNPAMRLRSERLRRLMLRKRAWKRWPFGIARLLERWNRTWKPYPPMDPAFRAELAALYEDDNTALAAWLGRDLSPWAS